jgi:xanthine dehydrogenase accessory factor
LEWAVKTPARYVGMIGSRRKVLSIYNELGKAGMERELFERVHAPIGLDIGAVTPEEIGVAIVAEMIAVRRNVSVAGKSKSVQERLKTADQPSTVTDKP